MSRQLHNPGMGRINPELHGAWKMAAFEAFIDRRPFHMIHTRELVLVKED